MAFTDKTDYTFNANWNVVAGVYGIMNSQKQMIYIGETDNLRRRMAEHKADTTHCMHRYAPSIVWVERIALETQRRTREQQLIGEYRPPCNQTM